jgi:hypothetical protein
LPAIWAAAGAARAAATAAKAKRRIVGLLQATARIFMTAAERQPNGGL